jgi:flagellar protein FlaG
VAGVVAVIAVVNAVMPAVGRSHGALVTASDVVNDRIASEVEIIHATGVDTATTSEAWVKNVGGSRIGPLDKMDLFFGPENAFQRIPYGGASCEAPCWEYELENDTEWGPTATLHITIHLVDPLAAGTTYFIKVVAPNGISDAKFFSI